MTNQFIEQTDFYEFTAGNALGALGDQVVEYDVFFRRNPWNGGYAIFSGLTNVINFITNAKFFNQSELEVFTHGTNLAKLEYPIHITSVSEGSVVFPNEPILTIRGKNKTLMLLETPILSIINHESLIATKAHRIVYGGYGDPAFRRKIYEFGSRRAHGLDAAVNGAFSAYTGGVSATSNTYAAMKYNIPPFGTMQHAFVQSYCNEYDAFDSYAKFSTERCLPTILLVDTYDVYQGITNAINIFEKYKKILFNRLPDIPFGIRIDSGDLAKLSKEIRRMLNNAGFENAVIIASNDLDEYIIDSLEKQEAKIDAYGVGTSLITARGWSDFGGVYKLSCRFEFPNLETVPYTIRPSALDKYEPVIKCSENSEKTTIPGSKVLCSVYKSTSDCRYRIADIIFLKEEFYVKPKETILAFDPKTDTRYKITKNKETSLIFKSNEEFIINDGHIEQDCNSRQRVLPTAIELQNFCRSEMEEYPKGIFRFENPQYYPVLLSEKLYNLRNAMIDQYRTINL